MYLMSTIKIESFSSKVCENHFDPSFIRMTSHIDEKPERVPTMQLEKPQLMAEAVPSIFEGCPKYLTTSKVHREGAEEKRCKIKARQLAQAIAVNEKSKLQEESLRSYSSFKELLTCNSKFPVSSIRSGVICIY
ncbi:hypothetical protein FQA39_LY00053 [Lamprigera yunnana]|nr:hypothetical protein FQA39_LY00053 [Lamprigera yunnana]